MKILRNYVIDIPLYITFKIAADSEQSAVVDAWAMLRQLQRQWPNITDNFNDTDEWNINEEEDINQ